MRTAMEMAKLKIARGEHLNEFDLAAMRREQAIRDARNGNIPPGCDYSTCEGCGRDTIVDKSGLCEECWSKGI